MHTLRLLSSDLSVHIYHSNYLEDSELVLNHHTIDVTAIIVCEDVY